MFHERISRAIFALGVAASVRENRDGEMEKPRLEIDGQDGLEDYLMHFSGSVRPTMLPLAQAEADVRRLLEFASLKLAGLSEGAQADWSRWFTGFIMKKEPDIDILLRPGALRALQRRAASVLTTYLAGKPVTYDAFPQGASVTRKTDGTPTVTIGMQASSLTLFTWLAIHAIVTVGKRLRRCANRTCGKAFVARRRQTYCTRECSDRVRLARFRARHAEDPGWRGKVRSRR